MSCKAFFQRRAGSTSIARILSVSLLALFLFALAGVPVSHAQIGTSDLIGTAKDTTGAVIPGSTVTLTNLDTGATRTVVSAANGDFTFSLISNGRYSVKVERAGFKTFTVAEVLVSAGDRARVDATLPLGKETESVTVSGTEAPLIKTDSSEVGSTLDEHTVQDVPTSLRNLTYTLEAQPGVNAGGGYGEDTTGGGQASGGGSIYDRRQTSAVVANGQPDEYNNHLIDGFDNNERQSGLNGLSPSIDGTAEVRIDTSNYSAEYGRTAGAVINVITKAGTNGYHGSVYEYFRNDITEASDYFATIKPEVRLNDFGGSFGGPIRKDKTFFFGDVEFFRYIHGKTYISGVPTAYEEAHPGDFSDTTVNGAPGPVLPMSALSPVALKYFALFPAPNLPGSQGNNYSSSPNIVQNSVTYDFRVDHHFSPSNLFFARFANNPVTTTFPEPFPEKDGIYPGGSGTTFPGPSSSKSRNLQFDFVHIFSPNLLLDLKAAYTRVNINTLPYDYGTNASAAVGMPNVYIPQYPDTNVLAGVGGPADQWSYLGSALSTPFDDVNNTFQYAGSIDYTHGSHSIKIGASLIRRQADVFQDAYAGGFFVFVGAPPFFDPRINFITGNAIVELRQNSLDHPGFRAWEPNTYITDNWRVTPSLTLNLGARYDVFTPFTEKHGHYVNFDPSTLGFILGSQDPHIGVKTDYHDFSPRVGFAYSITPQTVVHGAFGLSFFPPDIGIQSLGGAQGPVSIMQNYNPPYSFNFFGGGMPGVIHLDDGPAVPQAVDLSTYASNPAVTSLSYKPFNLHSSYVEQYNLSVEREFGKNAITIGGVGVLGHGIARGVNLEQAPPPGANKPTATYLYANRLPYVVSIGSVYNGGYSNYNGLQVIYNRRVSRGLTLSANYTYGHAMTDTNIEPSVTDVTRPQDDYGSSFLNVRHRFAAYGTYQLPFFTNSNGFEKEVLAGWQLNGITYWQTSTPFTVLDDTTQPNGPYAGNAFLNVQGISEDRPDVIAKVSLPHKAIGPQVEYFNTSAFTPQTSGTVGDEGVNNYYGPDDRRLDMSLMKSFPLRGEMALQFRAECFNVTNTPNFSDPFPIISSFNHDPVTGNDTTPAAVPFGTVYQTLTNESPRGFQFALKAIF